MYKSSKSASPKKVKIKKDENYFKNRYENACCPKSKNNTRRELSWLNCQGKPVTVQCLDYSAARKTIEKLSSGNENSCENATEEYLNFLKTSKTKTASLRQYVASSGGKSKQSFRSKKVSKNRTYFNKRKSRGRSKSISSLSKTADRNLEQEILSGLTCNGKPSITNSSNQTSDPVVEQSTTSEGLLPCEHVQMMKDFYDNGCVAFDSESIQEMARDYAFKNNLCATGFCFVPDSYLKYYEPVFNYSSPPYSNPLNETRDFGGDDSPEPEYFSEDENFYTKVPKVRLETPESFIRHVFFNYGVLPNLTNIKDVIRDSLDDVLRNHQEEERRELRSFIASGEDPVDEVYEEFITQENIDNLMGGIRETRSPEGLPIIEVNPIKGAVEPIITSLQRALSGNGTRIRFEEYDTDTIIDERDSGSDDSFYNGINLRKIKITNKPAFLLPEFAVTWKSTSDDNAIRVKPVDKKAVRIDLSSYPNHLKLLPIDGPNGFNQSIPNRDGVEKHFTPQGNEGLMNVQSYFNLSYNTCMKLENSFIARPTRDFYGINSYDKVYPKSVHNISDGEDDFSYDTTSPPFECTCLADDGQGTSWCLFDKTNEDKYIQVSRTNADILNLAFKFGSKKTYFHYDILRTDKESSENYRLKIFQDLNDVHYLNNLERLRIENNNQIIDSIVPQYLSGNNQVFDSINNYNSTGDSLFVYKQLKNINYDINIQDQSFNHPELTLESSDEDYYRFSLVDFLYDSDKWNRTFDIMYSNCSLMENDPSRDFIELGKRSRNMIFKSINDGNGSEYLDKQALIAVINQFPDNWKIFINKLLFHDDYRDLRKAYTTGLPGYDIWDIEEESINVDYGFFSDPGILTKVGLLVGEAIQSTEHLERVDRNNSPYFTPLIATFLGVEILDKNPQIFSKERLDNDHLRPPLVTLSTPSPFNSEEILPGVRKSQDMEFNRNLFAMDGFPYWTLTLDEELKNSSFYTPNPQSSNESRSQVFVGRDISNFPLKSFGLHIGCIKHIEDQLRPIDFSFYSGQLISRLNLKNFNNSLTPNMEKVLFVSSTSVETKFRKTIDYICQGIDSSQMPMPPSAALGNIQSISPKAGENRSTFHNGFSTELTTNIDMGKYALILGKKEDGSLGEFEFEFTYLTEIEEQIKRVVQVPVIGWIVALILIIVWVIVYIISVAIYSFSFIAVYFIVLADGAFDDGAASRNIIEGHQLINNIRKFSTSYDFNKVNIKVQSLASISKDGEGNSQITAGVRRYRVDKSRMISNINPFSFNRPEYDPSSGEYTQVEQTASDSSATREVESELSRESFSAATDYSFDFFSSSISEFARELIVGRRSPVVSAVGMLSEVLESDLHLKTLVESANKTINENILGLTENSISMELPEESTEQVETEYNNVTGSPQFGLLGGLCRPGGILSEDNEACVVHRLFSNVQTSFDSVNKICLSRIGVKTHYKSLKDINFHEGFLNGDSPPLRFCSSHESYTQFEKELNKIDREYEVPKSDIVLKSYDDIKIQLERTNYAPSEELEDQRKRAYPVGSNPIRYPWQMQCAMFTDIQVKGTNHLFFEAVSEIPNDDQVVEGENNGAVKLEINVDIFPQMTKSSINKINDIFLCKHNELCRPPTEIETIDMENDEENDFVVINGIRARTISRRAKEAQCSAITDLWLRLRVENTVGATPFNDVRYCNFPSIFGRDINGEGHPICHFRRGLMGVLFEQCQFLIRFLNDGIEDLPAPPPPGSRPSEAQCRAFMNSPAIDRFLERMEGIVNNCRGMVPNYNNTFEEKRVLIEGMDIVERRNNIRCEE